MDKKEAMEKAAEEMRQVLVQSSGNPTNEVLAAHIAAMRNNGYTPGEIGEIVMMAQRKYDEYAKKKAQADSARSQELDKEAEMFAQKVFAAIAQAAIVEAMRIRVHYSEKELEKILNMVGKKVGNIGSRLQGALR